MADIVFIHGINQELENASALEAKWIAALVRATRMAGVPAVADRLEGKSGPAIVAKMAFYGNYFLTQNQQGATEPIFQGEEREFAEALARTWLQAAAERATDPETRTSAKRELFWLNEAVPGEQGVRSLSRSALAALASVPGFAHVGVAMAERFVTRSIGQMTAYFVDDDMHMNIQKTVASCIKPETKVIIAHSLGSVVAYEILHMLDKKMRLPLLVTLGSPLGLRNVIYDRLSPQPPRFPHGLAKWLNLSDPNDFVAAAPDLAQFFGENKPVDASFESWTTDNGSDAHEAVNYLGKTEVGAAVAAALG
jgi:hypothetical protein